MLDQVKLLGSRKAYEFRPDNLRLSSLSIKPIQAQLQQLFQFQAALMATPMATFGDVPATYPPGFVFDMGVWISPEKQIVPIRFIHFEQRRIVIDVAGPSSSIAGIYEQMSHFLSEVQAPDGSPIVGNPERMLDHSVISAQFPSALDILFGPRVRKLFAKLTNTNVSGEKSPLLSTFIAQQHPTGQEIAKIAGLEDSYVFSLAQRTGTKPEEHIYLSGAPLDSEAHLSYLNELDAILRS